MKNSGASARSRTTVENSLLTLRQRIGLLRVGERKVIARIKVVYLIAPGVARLGEANVQGDQATTDVWIGPLEGHAALLVGIEAEMNEGANKAPALRCAHDQRLVIAPVDGICRASVVFLLVLEIGGKVTHRREPKTKDKWILGAVDELVNTSGLKSRRQANLPITGNRPSALSASTETPATVGNCRQRLLLPGPHGQCRQKPIGEGDPIVDAYGCITGVVHECEPAAGQVQRFRRSPHDQFAANQPGNRRAIEVLGSRDRERHSIISR